MRPGNVVEVFTKVDDTRTGNYLRRAELFSDSFGSRTVRVTFQSSEYGGARATIVGGNSTLFLFHRLRRQPSATPPTLQIPETRRFNCSDLVISTECDRSQRHSVFARRPVFRCCRITNRVHESCPIHRILVAFRTVAHLAAHLTNGILFLFSEMP